MLVKAKYAERFVATEPGERKTMEVRSKPVKFLQSGDRIVLVATNGIGVSRQILAVLEFQHCMELPGAILSSFTHCTVSMIKSWRSTGAKMRIQDCMAISSNWYTFSKSDM